MCALRDIYCAVVQNDNLNLERSINWKPVLICGMTFPIAMFLHPVWSRYLWAMLCVLEMYLNEDRKSKNLKIQGIGIRGASRALRSRLLCACYGTHVLCADCVLYVLVAHKRRYSQQKVLHYSLASFIVRTVSFTIITVWRRKNRYLLHVSLTLESLVRN